MGDLGSDLDAAVQLIMDNHAELKRIAPQHDELKYICDIDAGGFRWNRKHWTEFVKRHGTAGQKDLTMFEAQTNYFFALKNARVEAYRTEVCAAHEALRKIDSEHALVRLFDPHALEGLNEKNWNDSFESVIDRYFPETHNTINAVFEYVQVLKREAAQHRLF